MAQSAIEASTIAKQKEQAISVLRAIIVLGGVVEKLDVLAAMLSEDKQIYSNLSFLLLLQAGEKKKKKWGKHRK